MATLLPDYTQEMLPEIDRQLYALVNRPELDPYPGLAEMLSYHMGWEGPYGQTAAQGKRIRPLLVLITAGAFGADWRAALPAAVVVELIHNFSLIHDDIEDRSVLRRGRATLWDKWGQALAINAGDALFTLAYQAIEAVETTCGPEVMAGCFKIINQACLKLTGGQHLDISYEHERSLPVDSYWNMIAGKTAALLAACTGLGGLIGGATQDRLGEIEKFGYYLGLGFQVQDDWLGIWGDAALTGKSTESDLVTGKKTLPILFALQNEGEFAKHWLDGNIQGQDVAGLTRMLESEGAKSYTEAQVAELTGKAINALSAAQCSEPGGAILKKLALGLIGRQS